jgi:hypothetical protein
LTNSSDGISSRKYHQTGAGGQQLTRKPPGYVEVSSWVLDGLKLTWHAELQWVNSVYAVQAQKVHNRQDYLSWFLRTPS